MRYLTSPHHPRVLRRVRRALDATLAWNDTLRRLTRTILLPEEAARHLAIMAQARRALSRTPSERLARAERRPTQVIEAHLPLTRTRRVLFRTLYPNERD